MKLTVKTQDGMINFEAKIPESSEELKKEFDDNTIFLLTQKIMIIRTQDVFRRVYKAESSAAKAQEAIDSIDWKVREYHQKGVAMTPQERLMRDVNSGKLSLEALEAIIAEKKKQPKK